MCRTHGRTSLLQSGVMWVLSTAQAWCNSPSSDVCMVCNSSRTLCQRPYRDEEIAKSEQSPWELVGNVLHLERSDPRGWLTLRGNLSTWLDGVGQDFFCVCLASIQLYGWHGLKERKKRNLKDSCVVLWWSITLYFNTLYVCFCGALVVNKLFQLYAGVAFFWCRRFLSSGSA